MYFFNLKTKQNENGYLPIIDIETTVINSSVSDCNTLSEVQNTVNKLNGKSIVSKNENDTASEQIDESENMADTACFGKDVDLDAKDNSNQDNTNFWKGLSVHLKQSSDGLNYDLHFQWGNNLKDCVRSTQFKTDADTFKQFASIDGLSGSKVFLPTIVSRFVDKGTMSGADFRIGVVYTLKSSPESYAQSRLKDKKISVKERMKEKKKKTKAIQIPIIKKSGSNRRKMAIQVIPSSSVRSVFNTATLTEYCIKWCRNIYENRAILRPIRHTQTLILSIPEKENYFIQFAYGSTPLTDVQMRFQSEVQPTPVYVFHQFNEFLLFIKNKISYDA